MELTQYIKNLIIDLFLSDNNSFWFHNLVSFFRIFICITPNYKEKNQCTA